MRLDKMRSPTFAASSKARTRKKEKTDYALITGHPCSINSQPHPPSIVRVQDGCFLFSLPNPQSQGMIHRSSFPIWIFGFQRPQCSHQVQLQWTAIIGQWTNFDSRQRIFGQSGKPPIGPKMNVTTSVQCMRMRNTGIPATVFRRARVHQIIIGMSKAPRMVVDPPMVSVPRMVYAPRMVIVSPSRPRLVLNGKIWQIYGRDR